jgi:adenylylsulfate kinase-like enzyme
VNPPGLSLAEPLEPLLTLLPSKERTRFNEVASALHHTNHLLWSAEDGVRRNSLDAIQVADGKRAIDQLNMDRVRHAERLDEVIGAACPTPATATPLHTEPLSSVIDRLSVSVLRLHHTRLAADDAGVRARIAGVRTQLREVRESLRDLAEDVAAGHRRLPQGARLKLYGTTTRTETRPALSPHLPPVIALGGLSECGKTTSGIFLNRDEGAARFKIGYLLTQAAARQGLADPYALSPTRQAELLLGELNRFADAHRDTRLITIESVHRAESIAALKEMMGERLRVVYVDTPRALRLARSGGDERALEEKDRIKTERGADRIPTDTVLDNSGSVIRLHGGLRRLASPPADARFKTVIPEELGLPSAVCAATSRLLDALAVLSGEPCLAALTGSAVNGGWREGWSDIDLLLITESGHREGVTRAVDDYRSALQACGSTHLGATVLPLAEARVRRLPNRVLAALVMLQEGAPVLMAGPGLRLPLISRQEVERATPAALADAVATTRRLRHDPGRGNTRSLYKHLLLLCRLLLREQAVWVNGNDEVVSEALRLLPGLGSLDLPPLAEVIAAHRRGTDRARVLREIEKAVDRLLIWHQRQCAA